MKQIQFKAKIKVESNDTYWHTEKEIKFLESKLHNVIKIRFEKDGCLRYIEVPYKKTEIMVLASNCAIELMLYTGDKDTNGQKVFTRVL